MEKELGGLIEAQVRKATLYMIEMKLKPYETMAGIVKEACAGFGTDEILLTCGIIRFFKFARRMSWQLVLKPTAKPFMTGSVPKLVVSTRLSCCKFSTQHEEG